MFLSGFTLDKNYTNEMAVDESTLIFTRYLYPKYNVKHSFLMALLERQLDEALFWGYELYYSGFQEESMQFIESIYVMFYQGQNPTFSVFLRKMVNQWTVDPNLDWCFASIVVSLIHKSFDVSKFVETICQVKCKPPEQVTMCSKKTMNIVVNDDYIEKYKTMASGCMSTYRVLSTACRYSIRSNISRLFEFELSYDIMYEYYVKHWLYYAGRSPLWEDRLVDVGGELCHETKQVTFPNEDAEEKFYDKWAYNPDEQSLDVKTRCIGNPGDSQMSILEFCDRFGVEIEVPPRSKKRLVLKTEV
jgi:hypothetical protein